LEEVNYIRGLGFDGKSLVNPNQISVLHNAYAPSKIDVDWAIEVIEAAKEAKEQGLGVISLDGKMVDAPIIARAEWTLELAVASGMVRD